MKDIEILQKVVIQEVNAIKRYSAQIAETMDQEIKDAFKKLLSEERAHAGEAAAKIKDIDPSVTINIQQKVDEVTDDVVDKIDSYESLKGVIEISLEKERIAAANYEAWALEAQDPEIKSMLIAFKEDELQHKNRVVNLLGRVEVENGIVS